MSDPARGAEAEDAYGFPAGLWRWLQRHPPPALHRLTRFRSPLRGPWLTSVFGLVLLVALPFVIITGLLSYIAYAPQLGQAIPGDVGWLRLPAFTWPTRPSWLYRLTQGLHVGLGLVIIPVVLAKLWSVIPRLFVWPPARSIAQVLERLSVLMLVGGILFQIVTGVLNIQYDYIFGFSFYTGHYFGAWVFIAGFLLHIVVKIPHMVTGLRSIPMREVLGTNVADTRAQPCDPDGLVSVNPGEATLSRRGALGLVGAGVLLIGVLTVGQTLGGFTRKAALLLPRGRVVSPGDFPVNKTAAAAGITAEAIGPDWRLVLRGGPAEVVLDRATLAGLPQRTARLPLACVEGWSAVRTWSGVPLAELALLAGVPAARSARVTSLQRGGAFGEAGGKPDRRPRCAAGVAGRRGGSVAGSWLPGPHHRSRTARCAQHEMGRWHRIPQEVKCSTLQRVSKTPTGQVHCTCWRWCLASPCWATSWPPPGPRRCGTRPPGGSRSRSGLSPPS